MNCQDILYRYSWGWSIGVHSTVTLVVGGLLCLDKPGFTHSCRLLTTGGIKGASCSWWAKNFPRNTHKKMDDEVSVSCAGTLGGVDPGGQKSHPLPVIKLSHSHPKIISHLTLSYHILFTKGKPRRINKFLTVSYTAESEGPEIALVLSPKSNHRSVNEETVRSLPTRHDCLREDNTNR